MNNNISTRTGVIVIAAVIFILSVFVYRVYKSAIVEQASLNSSTTISQEEACKPRAFTGKAQIKGWYVQENAEKVVRVADDDVSKLPANGEDVKNKIQVVDITPEMEKKLQKSSEKNPQTLTITGFAIPCNKNIALASIGYKDGIFRPFLK